MTKSESSVGPTALDTELRNALHDRHRVLHKRPHNMLDKCVVVSALNKQDVCIL